MWSYDNNLNILLVVIVAVVVLVIIWVAAGGNGLNGCGGFNSCGGFGQCARSRSLSSLASAERREGDLTNFAQNFTEDALITNNNLSFSGSAPLLNESVISNL